MHTRSKGGAALIPLNLELEKELRELRRLAMDPNPLGLPPTGINIPGTSGVNDGTPEGSIHSSHHGDDTPFIDPPPLKNSDNDAGRDPTEPPGYGQPPQYQVSPLNPLFQQPPNPQPYPQHQQTPTPNQQVLEQFQATQQYFPQERAMQAQQRPLQQTYPPYQQQPHQQQPPPY
jgi:hypothetical protein